MLVCKLFIQSQAVYGPGSSRYTLGAVCRGEINKDWAAATPAATLETPSDDVLDRVFLQKLAGGSPEVLCYTQPDPNGRWAFRKCEFSYGGVAVEFVYQGEAPNYGSGKFSMTVNNSEATKVLRRQFAESLETGKPSMFSLIFKEADDA